MNGWFAGRDDLTWKINSLELQPLDVQDGLWVWRVNTEVTVQDRTDELPVVIDMGGSIMTKLNTIEVELKPGSEKTEGVEFEDKLIASMPKTCDVDGYDVGSGTINFFVHTDSPLAALKHFRTYLGTNKVEKNLRVSYREVDGDAYTNMWPFRDPRPFDISYPEGVDPFSAKRTQPDAGIRSAFGICSLP
jgi:hypothetical protein